MRKQLDKQNYFVVDNFIDPQHANDLYESFKQYAFDFPEHFKRDEQCPLSMAIYDYRDFLELLVEKTSFMTKFMEETMLPTYCYSRLYAKNDELLPHMDRPSCEVSVTLHLGGDKAWPIFFTTPEGKKVSVELKPGQGVIYLGMISTHWRNKFKGKKYGQVFLHYVKSRGEHWRHYFDKSNSGNK
jgi:hypothetical protein